MPTTPPEPSQAETRPPGKAAAQAQEKAAVLREALPWITRFHGATVVIKYGGNAMVDEGLKRSLAADVALLHFVGLRPVLVHGGGPQIDEVSQRMGLERHFEGGLRVTDDDTMDVVRMVLLGKVNPELVGLVTEVGAPAIGVSGTDAGLLQVSPARGPQGEDLGRVGQVTSVNPGVLQRILDEYFVPVVATVGRDREGLDRNINSDAAAGAIAAALDAAKIVYLTDVGGLYQDPDEPDSLISELPVHRLAGMLQDQAIGGGMRPKAASVVHALSHGVAQAHLLDGRMRHALLLEIFTDEGVGTMVTSRGSTTNAGNAR